MAPLLRTCASCLYLLPLLVALLPCCLVRLAGLVAAQSQPGAEVDEAQLLLQIKSAWGDPPVLEGWKNTSGVGGHCSWPYVQCDAAGGVMNLTITSASVKGPFPDAVGGLSALAYLDVSNNTISGAFLTTLYRCTSLDYLDLSYNNFSDELPSDIGHRLAKYLTTLFLYSNRFSGTIPEDHGTLTRLQKLALGGNPFDAGKLPASFKSLSKLVVLWASQCNLVGDFPSHVLDMSELEVLDLSHNNFSGELPTDIGRRLAPNLTTLYLHSNRFSSTIPADLGALTRLKYLDLGENPFDAGELPTSFKNLSKLVWFSASQCNLVGDFPRSVLEMSELEVLDLSNNELTGSIPPRIWSLKKLQELYVYRTNLTGEIVVDEFAAKSLTLIAISDNYNLTGSIPEVIGHLENLTRLILSDNNFSGEIPASIGRLPSLYILDLSNNRFNGPLSPELGKHSELVFVIANYNELTSAIPEGLCARGQFQYLSARGNHLNGSIPTGLANCATLQTLALDDNQLSGDVPLALWTASQPQYFFFREQDFTCLFIKEKKAKRTANITKLRSRPTEEVVGTKATQHNSKKREKNGSSIR